MRVLFLGFTLPEAEAQSVMDSDAFMPAQTHRFGWSVVKGLAAAGAEVDLIAAAPASDYPHNSQILFHGFRYREAGLDGRAIGFVNITPLKHITRYVGARRALRASAGVAADAVVVHGLNSAFLWAALHGARRLRARTVVIVTDPPAQRLPTDSGPRWWMKRTDLRLITGALRRVDGAVVLSRRLAEDFLPGVPYLVLEGIASPLPEAVPGERGASGHEVVYAGSLVETYGVGELMDAADIAAGDWHLSIYGQGPMEEQVRQRAERSAHVSFGGRVAPAELARAYADADLLVNPRGATQDFVLYSFPSKLLEYLGSGTPVMSTRLPTIPPEYDGCLYWTDDDAASLASAISEVLARPEQERASIAAAGRRLAESRSIAAQGRRLVGFLASLGTAT